MKQDRIFVSCFLLKLTNCLQKRLTFHITYSSSHFNYGDPVFVLCFWTVKAAFDLICNVRDHLNGPSPKISMPFLLKNRPVNLPGCYIGILVQILINKTFIMTKIQVCFCSVFCNEYFSVLDGIHSSRVYIDIGIKFLHGHLTSSGFQKPSKGCCRDSLSKTGYYSSGNKYIFYHLRFPPPDHKKSVGSLKGEGKPQSF